MVQAMVGYGISQDEICRVIENPYSGNPIDKKTLEKHFRRELDIGMTVANAKVAESLYQNAVVNQNVTAQIWWTKTRMRWSEHVRHEHTGKGGGPITAFDLSRATDEQLTALETLFGPLAGTICDDEAPA